MKVGDVRKWLPKDDEEEIVIAWWEYGDGESWPDWLTKEVWEKFIRMVDKKHDWSYEHDAICDHFEYLLKMESEEK